jgi:hypothetical protein
MCYTYIVLINNEQVDHFRLPFKLNEEKIKAFCQVEIKPIEDKWAHVFLNDCFIYKFPILNEEDVKKFQVEVKFHSSC